MNAITYYYGDTYEAKEYKSNIHIIGNFSFKFSRFTINDNMIFLIEIFTVDGIKITDFKMDFITAKELYGYIYRLAFGTVEFKFKLPPSNTIEDTYIQGVYSAHFSGSDFQIVINKTKYNENKMNIIIPFRDLGEMDTFQEMYFFHLLIDIVDEIDISEVWGSL